MLLKRFPAKRVPSDRERIEELSELKGTVGQRGISVANKFAVGLIGLSPDSVCTPLILLALGTNLHYFSTNERNGD
jgi:hypothetical protein